MGLILSDGFDGHISLASRWTTVSGSASIVTDGGKFGAGSNCLRLSGSNVYNEIFISEPKTNPVGSPENPVHVSFYFKSSTKPGSDSPIFMARSSTDGNDGFVVELKQSSGALAVTYFTSSLTPSSIATIIDMTSMDVADGSWHHIEFKFTRHDSTGIVKVWVDGVLDIDYSGDTAASGTLTSRGLTLFLVSSGQTSSVDFDDILIWDEEGSAMNTSGQLGSHRIETLKPSSTGNSTQFSVTGAANNWDAVDEFSADGDTSYVSSSTNNHVDLYGYTDMVGNPASIHGVNVTSIISCPVSGFISFRTKARQGATTGSGSTQVIAFGGSYNAYDEFFALNPNGNVAWTKSTVDSAEFGVEVLT